MLHFRMSPAISIFTHFDQGRTDGIGHRGGGGEEAASAMSLCASAILLHLYNLPGQLFSIPFESVQLSAVERALNNIEKTTHKAIGVCVCKCVNCWLLFSDSQLIVCGE